MTKEQREAYFVGIAKNPALAEATMLMQENVLAACEKERDALHSVCAVVPEDLAELMALRAENDKLRTALEQVMVGGNHLASYLIGHDETMSFHKWAAYEVALEKKGVDVADVWVCWRTIMNARAALAPAQAEPQEKLDIMSLPVTEGVFCDPEQAEALKPGDWVNEKNRPWPHPCHPTRSPRRC
jgi:hypothetical protein